MHRPPRLPCDRLFRCIFKFCLFIFVFETTCFFAHCFNNFEYLSQDEIFGAQQKLSTFSDCTKLSCSRGYKCFLEEMTCNEFPCKLSAICAPEEDVHEWLHECNKIGCFPNHKCFLRNSHRTCKLQRCDKVFDCLDDAKIYFGHTKSMELCRGWICPPKLMCYADTFCTSESCSIERRCKSMRNYEESVNDRLRVGDLENDPLIKDLEVLMSSLNDSVPEKIEHDRKYITPAQVTPDQPTLKIKRLSEIPEMRREFVYTPTYLKHVAGHEAVQYWMEKSKYDRNQDYKEFLKWMTVVENLLDPELYKMWLEKVTIATSDVPEFQLWLSLRNLEVHRSSVPRRLTPKARTYVEPSRTAADITVPDSINLQAKNLFYSDNFIFVDPSANPRPTFVDKQSVSSVLGHQRYFPRYENKNQQPVLPQNVPQHNPYKDQPNFNYNYEPKRFEDSPHGYDAPMPPIPTVPYFEPIRRDPNQEYIIPDPRQIGPVPIHPEYAEAQPPDVNSYYLSNYTQVQNISFTATPNFDNSQQHHRQPRFFFPNTQVQSNQWTQHWSKNLPPKRDSPVDQPIIPHQGEMREDPLSIGVDTMLDQVSGLQQYKNLKPNIIKLEPGQPVSQMVLPSNTNNIRQMPNLLIYFPPPLNFFIYYSTKNQTEYKAPTTTEKPTSVSSSADLPEGVDFKLFSGNVRETNKSEKLDKHKELEYIRKIIKELIEYWDEKEKNLERSKKTDGEPSAESPNKKTDDYILTTPKPTLSVTRPSVQESKAPSFNAFLEWLSQNSDKKFAFSDRDLHNKRPANQHDSEVKDKSVEKNDPPSLSDSVDFRSFIEDTKAPTEKKIRILVDIDKNPELIKLLFAKNKINNSSSDSNEYQIIVNLEDFVKPNEEDLISRRLIDIATNQLHRNVTDEKKIPKILWVFPIYDDDKDETLINEFEKKNKEKLTIPPELNIQKRNRHRNHSDKRTPKNEIRTTAKPKSKKTTKPSDDPGPEDPKDDEYDNYDDQSYYDQQDQKSEEDISREDS